MDFKTSIDMIELTSKEKHSEPPINNFCHVHAPLKPHLTLGFNKDDEVKVVYLHLDVAGAKEVKRFIDSFLKRNKKKK